MNFKMKTLRLAGDLITKCEADLNRRLSDGECRDLLKDNTAWDSDFIAALVRAISEERLDAIDDATLTEEDKRLAAIDYTAHHDPYDREPRL
jgi:hypothetical protein